MQGAYLHGRKHEATQREFKPRVQRVGRRKLQDEDFDTAVRDDGGDAPHEDHQASGVGGYSQQAVIWCHDA